MAIIREIHEIVKKDTIERYYNVTKIQKETLRQKKNNRKNKEKYKSG